MKELSWYIKHDKQFTFDGLSEVDVVFLASRFLEASGFDAYVEMPIPKTMALGRCDVHAENPNGELFRSEIKQIFDGHDHLLNRKRFLEAQRDILKE